MRKPLCSLGKSAKLFLERIAHEKFLEVQKPFFKKVFGRRRQIDRKFRDFFARCIF